MITMHGVDTSLLLERKAKAFVRTDSEGVTGITTARGTALNTVFYTPAELAALSEALVGAMQTPNTTFVVRNNEDI